MSDFALRDIDSPCVTHSTIRIVIGECDCSHKRTCDIEQPMDVSYCLSRKYDSLQKRNIFQRIKACLYVAGSDIPIGL